MIKEQVFIDRIKSPIPARLPVVPVSFPVTSFGNVNRARVLTVGLNPSSSEFMTPGNKSVLVAGKKRFVDRETLGLGQDQTPNDDQAREILRSNNEYFESGNHYGWFDKMEETVLRPLGYSYFDGTAAHVDVLQWATHPLWSGLEDDVFTPDTVRADIDFLKAIFAGRTFDYVLFNGRDVYTFFREHKLFHLHDRIELKPGSDNVFFWTGHVSDSPLLSWSTNVPDFRTSNDSKRRLSSLLAKFARNDKIIDPRKPRGTRFLADTNISGDGHICPICKLNVVHGHPQSICWRCVERAETVDGLKIILYMNGDDLRVTAKAAPNCEDTVIIGDGEICFESGDTVWIDGVECLVWVKDEEIFQIVIPEPR